MSRRALSWVGLALICGTAGVERPAVSVKLPTREAASHLPLRFEANEGQWDERVRFRARSGGATFFVTDDGMTVRRNTGVLNVHLVGERNAKPLGESALETRSNFFLGNDPSRWRTNVPNYARVRTRDAVPGVDVVWHDSGAGLEYDLEVAAGVDASTVVIAFDGADSLTVAPDGSLEIATSAGRLSQRPARVVQAGRELRATYVPLDAAHVRIALDDYDPSRPALIDPVLSYSTYLGGSGDVTDQGSGIAVDSSGNAYMVGYAGDADFPTKNAFQPTIAGNNSVVVSKLDPTGASLVYSTYLGGTGNDQGNAIAVDGSGNAYVTGYATSTDFPTHNPLQSTNAGGGDAFAAVLDSTGSALVYSTYLGGAGEDSGNGIAVDSSGDAYVVGSTTSTNFPTKDPYQATNNGSTNAFVAKLNASGAALVYSTYLGGGWDDVAAAVALDASGAAYVTGTTSSSDFPVANAFQSTAGAETTSYAFVTKLNAAGSALAYSTYLGGGWDNGFGIAVDAAGSAYVTGSTRTNNFPLQNPLYSTGVGFSGDGFVTKLSPAGSSLVYSTYLGGSWREQGSGIAVDSSGNAYVTGTTAADDLPTQNPLQATNAGRADAFILVFDSTGASLVYGTYLGGTQDDGANAIAIDSSGNAYITGITSSFDFPTQTPIQAANNNYTSSAFVAKIANPNSPNGTPCVPGACASGNCVDGYCCDTPCTDQCAACDLPGKLGTCSLVPYGPPHGSRPGCADAGAGVCALQCGGLDDTTQCTYPTATVACSATCKSAVETDTFCNGAGLCDIVEAHGCNDFACSADAGTCLTTCASDNDCVSGFGCVDGGCLVPTKCIDQRTAQPANGPSIDCAPYRCVNGCTTSCTSDNDCTSPATCIGSQCVPPAPPSTSGCTCDTSSGGRDSGRLTLLGALAAALALRRRNVSRRVRRHGAPRRSHA